MDHGLGIAVIGVSCAFPGAATPDQFWRNIAAGVESLTTLDAAELAASGEHPEFLASPHYVPVAACMDGAELFDGAFFGLTPREAREMDPQHRIFLEHSWRALESAGYDPRNTGCPVGVYAGEGINTYVQRLRAVADAQSLKRQGLRLEGVGGIGNDLDFLTTRVSYELNLTGPSVPIATACSSSLVAVHLACQALRTYECDMSLAGGVAVTPPVRRGYLHAEGGILSRDGHTRAFDADSSGTVLGSGVGVVVLKRLEDAQADGDDIIGIIRGSAINNDGSARAGFTAPGIDGQSEVISLAQDVADVDPDTITYLEAHGTATRIGDPIEIEALTRAFREKTDRQGFCTLGSVKANIGHMDAAAGVAGLIKALYAAREGIIPPQINFRSPNSALSLDTSPFRITTQREPWRTPSGTPRRAGISSFGFGGTNAHVVIEQPPAVTPAPDSGTEASAPQLLPVSAHDEAAAREAVLALAQSLESAPPRRLADVAHTLQKGRSRFPVRVAVAARTADEAAGILRKRATGTLAPSRGAVSPGFLFPGQGAQYPGMAAGLHRELPAFAEEFDRVAAAFEPLLGLDLRTAVLATDDTGSDLHRTRLSQPALFTVEYALAQVLIKAGVTPAALLGHSIGELVAATVAGVWELDDAVRVVDARSRLMQAAPAGAMAAVRRPAGELLSMLPPGTEIAAINAPDHTVISGTPAAIGELTALLTAQGTPVRPLSVSHAYHSSSMEAAAAEFARFMRDVPARAPSLPYVSNVTGTWATEADVRDPEYWSGHLRHAVRFADGLAVLPEKADGPWLQVGPGRSVLAFARAAAPGSPRPLIPLLDGEHVRTRDDMTALTSALAALWESGAELSFDAWPGAVGRRVPLPTYPFQRRRHWVESPSSSPEPPAPTPAPAPAPVPAGAEDATRDPDRWLSMPAWQEIPPARWDSAAPQRPPAVLIARPGPLADALRESLGTRDGDVQVVGPTRIDTWTPPRERHVIVFADGLGEPHDPLSDGTGPEHARHRLIALTRRLAAAECHHDLLVVTDGAFDVVGTEDLAPDRALLAGLCKVIPKELPRVSCRLVDVDLAAGPATVAAGIAAEAATVRPASVTCHRGTRRWIQRVAPLQVPEPALADTGLRYRGVYLITGGLGGIGLSLAGFLARRCRARLVLVGRTELPPRAAWDDWITAHGPEHPVSRRIAGLRGLTEAGAEVLPLRADVADQQSITSAVEAARAAFGGIDGVIHAAGESGDGLLRDLSPDRLEAVLRPKVTGTRNLWRAMGEQPVDFFALFSSLSTVDAWDGTGAYTAANAYLDAFAHAARRRGRTDVLAIDWTGWWRTGMNAPTDTPAAEAPKHLYLSEDEGHAAFVRALAAALPQVHVSVTDLTELHARGERISLRTPAPGSPRDTSGGSAPAEPITVPRTGAYEQPRSPREAHVCDEFGAVLGFAGVARDDNFFTLGGDSLAALELLSRVRSRYGADVLLQEFFSDPTPGGLAERLDRAAGGPGPDDKKAAR